MNRELNVTLGPFFPPGYTLDDKQMGQEVQVRISDVNTDNNTVNLSMVPAGAYDDRSGGYGTDRPSIYRS